MLATAKIPLRRARLFCTDQSPFSNVIVCLSGKNRMGMVHELCRDAITPLGGNLGQTRMSLLGTDFCVMAEVHIQRKFVPELEATLQKQFGDCLVRVKETKGTDWTSEEGLKKAEAAAAMSQKIVRIFGPDDFGILEKFTDLFANKGINIKNLSSDIVRGPHIGYDVFDTSMTLGVPATVPTDELAKEIQQIAERAGVEAHLSS